MLDDTLKFIDATLANPNREALSLTDVLLDVRKLLMNDRPDWAEVASSELIAERDSARNLVVGLTQDVERLTDEVVHLDKYVEILKKSHSKFSIELPPEPQDGD